MVSSSLSFAPRATLFAALLASVLTTCYLAPRGDSLDTHVRGAVSRIGFPVAWQTRFAEGQTLTVWIDSAMPRGYQRVYLADGSDIIGWLPETAARVVRTAVQAGRRPEVRLATVDPTDPARGLRVRVRFLRAVVDTQRSMNAGAPPALRSVPGGNALEVGTAG